MTVTAMMQRAAIEAAGAEVTKARAELRRVVLMEAPDVVVDYAVHLLEAARVRLLALPDPDAEG
ncbi:hypothetical protein [Paraburkholderia sp. 40]|uniref:hypothetical protein n=1 Tax=Paraburkholderia sp. 40 TaxID=2991059 RepID=UPI003D1EFFAD